MEQTCKTCEWWCWHTWEGNTCDNWESEPIFTIEVPDDLISLIKGEPTSVDFSEMHRQAENAE